MKYLYVALAAVAAGSVAAGLFFRFAPIAPQDWHVDPVTVVRPDRDNHYLLRAEDGHGPAPVFGAEPEKLSFELYEIVSALPRSEVIAGSAAERHFTVVVRSQVMGFPDFVTVKAIEADGGSALVIFSRSRYGYSDLGVNKARVEAWVQELEQRLKP
ncbi:MAG TPA: DUF1499 domain-containing protein [Kiloniellaceae bacterium]|nr:DUF1499 domain-containing protein [Kiloniellaceae bacterium]